MYHKIMSNASFTPQQNDKRRRTIINNQKERSHQEKLAKRRELHRRRQENLQYTQPLVYFLQTKYPTVLAEYNIFYSNLKKSTGAKRNLLHTLEMQKWMDTTTPVELKADINQALSTPSLQINSYEGPRSFTIKNGTIEPKIIATSRNDKINKENQEIIDFVRSDGMNDDNSKDNVSNHVSKDGASTDLNTSLMHLDSEIDDLLKTINLDDIMNMNINIDDYDFGDLMCE